MVFYNLSGAPAKIALMMLCLLLFREPRAAAVPVREAYGPAQLIAQGPALHIIAPPQEAHAVSEAENGDYTGAKADDAVRTVPDSVIAGLRDKRYFAYANDPAYWKTEKPADDWLLFLFARNAWIKVLLYILLGAFLLYVLYRIIVTNKLYLFYSAAARRLPEGSEAIEAEDERLEEKIAAQIEAGNYRPAIRLMYLKALKLMNEKGWIQLTAGRTNRDYVSAVSQRPAADSFRLITRNYEYIWYGEFELNKYGFEILQDRFERFYKTVQG